MKVMIVDDEKAMHLIMRRMLSKLPDIEIVGCFSDTASATTYVEEHDVHMAFVDISMPGETGLQFTERMAVRHPNLHIVFVTSHKDFALDAFELSALDYIVKPVSLERIEKSVKRVMAVHRSTEMARDDRGTNRVCIYGLGGLEVRVAQGSVKWTSRKSAELFGYLLLSRGRMVSRVRIITDVFGEMPYKNAETYLNTAIYQLRKSLEPHGMKSIIESDNDGYGLNIADVYIDFAEFEDRVKRMAVIEASNHDLLLETEELYAGDLFGEKAYGWALYEMERLSAMYAGFAKNLARVLLEERCEYGTAISLLNKLLSRNELDEETVWLLLGAYAAQKDKISLTKLYKRYGKLLRKELGVSPSKELVDWYAGLQAELESGANEGFVL